MTEEVLKDIRMDLAVAILLKLWTHPTPWYYEMPLIEGIANQFDVESDQLREQFNEAFVFPLLMDAAVARMLEVWPYDKPFGPDAVKITKKVATEFGVEWDDLVLRFSDVFVWPHEKVVRPIDEAMQELTVIWGPEYSMSEEDVSTLKRLARKYDVNWAELYGHYVETDHRMCKEEEF